MSSLHCAHCRHSRLTPKFVDQVEIDCCNRCGGLWFDHSELGKVISSYDEEFVANSITHNIGQRVKQTNMPCPRCRLPLAEYEYHQDYHLDVELCESCHGIWLDRGQLELVLETGYAQRGMEKIDQELKLTHRLFQFFTSLPVEFNVETRQRAYATKALIFINIFIFAMMVISQNDGWMVFALWPNEAPSLQWMMGLITGAFMHAGIMHLVGNMYFLYVLGDNIEDILTRRQYLALYFGAALVGGIAQTLAMIGVEIPVIGASGAVAGLMGFYIVIFRKAYLTFMIVVFQWKIPALGYFGIWLAFNVLGAALDIGNVAWWDHLGGFFVGVSAAFIGREAILRRNPVLRLMNLRKDT